MRKFKKVLSLFIVFILIYIYVYVCNITFLPDSFILKQGEQLNLKILYGITLDEKNDIQTLQASSNLNKNKVSKTSKVNVNLFGKIPIKEINVNIIPETSVIPIGKIVGMKLYTDGVLVVGTSEINRRKTI